MPELPTAGAGSDDDRATEPVPSLSDSSASHPLSPEAPGSINLEQTPEVEDSTGAAAASANGLHDEPADTEADMPVSATEGVAPDETPSETDVAEADAPVFDPELTEEATEVEVFDPYAAAEPAPIEVKPVEQRAWSTSSLYPQSSAPINPTAQTSPTTQANPTTSWPPPPPAPDPTSAWPVPAATSTPAAHAWDNEVTRPVATTAGYGLPATQQPPRYVPTTDGSGWGQQQPAPTDEWDATEDPGSPPPPKQSGLSMLWPWGLHGLVETVEVLALALLMFVLVRSVAQNFVVEGGSMEPTFHNGEMLIVNKLSYRTFDVSWLPFTDKHNWRPFGTPKAGDVVVFKFPQDQTRDFIKRVVAVPGQSVEVRGGKVYIDGVVRNEPYLDQAPTYDYGPATVPEGQLFVLGDNRNNSYDSHSWGMLDQKLLIGRTELRYWPLSRFGRIDHGGLSPGAAVTVTEEAGATATP